jgi:succinoglycan biosynthesis transport protein ExoP
MNSISPQMLGLHGPVTLLKGPVPGEGPPRERGAALKRLLRLAVRWRLILAAGVLAGALTGGVVTLVSTRQYASTVRLQISRETAQVVNLGSVSRDVSIGDQEFYQTQYGLLRAQALAERVAGDLGVVDDGAFFDMFGKSDDFTDHPGPAGRAKRMELAGHILLDHVDVAPIHGSSLVDVQARAPSPELSQKIARLWGQDFIASNLERRLAPSTYARQFLEARLDQLRDRLQASERRAVDYAAAHGVIDLPPSGGGPKPAATTTTDFSQSRSLVTDDLVALNVAREAATADSIKANSELAAFDRQPDASEEALKNRAIASLRSDRAAAAADYAKIAQARPDDPAAKAARAQVDSLDAAIKGEENRIRASLQQTYQAASARQAALTRQVDALKASLADQRQRAIQYNIYQRDVAANRELYDALLQRYKEVGVAGEALSNNVAVVDEARLPDKPSSPRLSVNLLLFTLAGAILAALAVAVLDQLDDREPSPDEPALSPTPLSEAQR